jgi:hypothetical protein
MNNPQSAKLKAPLGKGAYSYSKAVAAKRRKRMSLLFPKAVATALCKCSGRRIRVSN